MKIFECKCCGKKIDIDKDDYFKAGWDYIYDVSNGLLLIKVCNECNEKIQFHIRALEDMMKMPFWKLNFSAKEERYE